MSQRQGADEQPRPAGAEDRGTRLCTLRRARGEELRVSLSEWEGHEYLDLRLWCQGYPVKGKGVTVRLHELEDVIQALGRALELTGHRRPASGPAGPPLRDDRRVSPPPRRPPDAPTLPLDRRAPFDECGADG